MESKQVKYTAVWYTCAHCDALVHSSAPHKCRLAPPAVGWRCPSCKSVWGPSVEGCKVCNRSEINL